MLTEKDNVTATVFGELWKLEPLCEEKKIRWRKEMDWLLSRTTYMVELVPTKQSGADGCTFEVISLRMKCSSLLYLVMK